ncbi:MAG: TIGR02453 family protein [Arcobacter sp.]|nr:MAG: TIGR02453 family protein [Arcobacter sp.]
MEFDGFKEEALSFLDEIEQNNNKVWFENNRHRWEEVILKPNKAYVEEMGEHLIALAPLIKAQPKMGGSLFKIYRDTRFSHDKTPIKTKIGIMFWQGALHRMKCPAFYMQYKSHEVLIATGIRKFKDELLSNYREYIKVEKNAKALHEILENLKSKGIKLPEMHYKRTPIGFDKENKYSYLARYDGMLVYKTFKPNKTFHSKKIINYNFKFYDSTLELFNWLDEFVKSIKE